MSWQLYLVTAGLFGGGLFWISRAPAGWNWQKTVATIIAIIGMSIPFVVKGVGSLGASFHRDLSLADRPTGSPPAASAPAPTASSVGVDDARAQTAKVAKDANRTGQEQGFGKGHAVGVEEGINRILKPNKPIARFADEIRLIPTGPGKYAIPFRSNGISRIDTGLPLPCGKSYYIWTTRPIPRLQIGYVDATGLAKFLSPPPSKLREDAPFHLVMASEVAQDAKLVFLTELVPEGDYEIRIIESLASTGIDEYAPGVRAKEIFFSK